MSANQNQLSADGETGQTDQRPPEERDERLSDDEREQLRDARKDPNTDETMATTRPSENTPSPPEDRTELTPAVGQSGNRQGQETRQNTARDGKDGDTDSMRQPEGRPADGDEGPTGGGDPTGDTGGVGSSGPDAPNTGGQPGTGTGESTVGGPPPAGDQPDDRPGGESGSERTPRGRPAGSGPFDDSGGDSSSRRGGAGSGQPTSPPPERVPEGSDAENEAVGRLIANNPGILQQYDRDELVAVRRGDEVIARPTTEAVRENVAESEEGVDESDLLVTYDPGDGFEVTLSAQARQERADARAEAQAEAEARARRNADLFSESIELPQNRSDEPMTDRETAGSGEAGAAVGREDEGVTTVLLPDLLDQNDGPTVERDRAPRVSETTPFSRDLEGDGRSRVTQIGAIQRSEAAIRERTQRASASRSFEAGAVGRNPAFVADEPGGTGSVADEIGEFVSSDEGVASTLTDVSASVRGFGDSLETAGRDAADQLQVFPSAVPTRPSAVLRQGGEFAEAGVNVSADIIETPVTAPRTAATAGEQAAEQATAVREYVITGDRTRFQQETQEDVQFASLAADAFAERVRTQPEDVLASALVGGVAGGLAGRAASVARVSRLPSADVAGRLGRTQGRLANLTGTDQPTPSARLVRDPDAPAVDVDRLARQQLADRVSPGRSPDRIPDPERGREGLTTAARRRLSDVDPLDAAPEVPDLTGTTRRARQRLRLGRARLGERVSELRLGARQSVNDLQREIGDTAQRARDLLSRPQNLRQRTRESLALSRQSVRSGVFNRLDALRGRAVDGVDRLNDTPVDRFADRLPGAARELGRETRRAELSARLTVAGAISTSREIRPSATDLLSRPFVDRSSLPDRRGIRQRGRLAEARARRRVDDARLAVRQRVPDVSLPDRQSLPDRSSLPDGPELPDRPLVSGGERLSVRERLPSPSLDASQRVGRVRSRLSETAETARGITDLTLRIEGERPPQTSVFDVDDFRGVADQRVRFGDRDVVEDAPTREELFGGDSSGDGLQSAGGDVDSDTNVGDGQTATLSQRVGDAADGTATDTRRRLSRGLRREAGGVAAGAGVAAGGLTGQAGLGVRDQANQFSAGGETGAFESARAGAEEVSGQPSVGFDAGVDLSSVGETALNTAVTAATELGQPTAVGSGTEIDTRVGSETDTTTRSTSRTDTAQRLTPSVQDPDSSRPRADEQELTVGDGDDDSVGVQFGTTAFEFGTDSLLGGGGGAFGAGDSFF